MVVVPALDEEDRVATTVAGIPRWVDEIVVVDDGSRDRTAHRARAADLRVAVLRHAAPRGVGAAIAAGYREARRRGAAVVVVMAGDGQMDPRDLPAIVAPIARGDADYVKGNRLGHPDVRSMPLARRVGTTLFGHATSAAIGVPGLSDSQCGYTAIRGALLDVLPLERLWPSYGYPNDLLSQIALAGGRIVEVPVRPVYAGERSGLRARHALVIAALIARAAARRGGAVLRR